MRSEMRRNVTVSVGEVSHRLPKGARVRRSSDIVPDSSWQVRSIAGPEPDADSRAGAFHGVPAATVVVERRSVGEGGGGGDTAACVTVDGGITVKSINSSKFDEREVVCMSVVVP